MYVLENGTALAPAMACVCLLRNMAIRLVHADGNTLLVKPGTLAPLPTFFAADSCASECEALTDAGCIRAMAHILNRACAVQSITPDIVHHPILQQACGVFLVSVSCCASLVTL